MSLCIHNARLVTSAEERAGRRADCRRSAIEAILKPATTRRARTIVIDARGGCCSPASSMRTCTCATRA